MGWGRNILTPQEYEIKHKSKTRFNGGGVSSNSSLKKAGMMEIITKANVVIGSYNDGAVRVLKDRHRATTSLHGKATVNQVIELASELISHSVFGENDLHMFKEGLNEQIQIAVKEAIEKYHTKEGGD